MTVSVQLPNPETDIGDFVATIIELRAREVEIQNQMLRLALVAVSRGWAETMASHLGVSRPTIYDWADVARLFGEVSPDIPLWLYVAAARMAKKGAADEDRQKELADAIIGFCIENGVTPSEMMAIIRRTAPPIIVEGEAVAEYPRGKIVLSPKKPPRFQPPYVRYRIIGTEPGSADETGRPSIRTDEELRAAILKILDSGASGS